MFLDERMNNMKQQLGHQEESKGFDQHVYSNVSEETGANNIYEQIEGDVPKFPRGSVYENSSGDTTAAERQKKQPLKAVAATSHDVNNLKKEMKSAAGGSKLQQRDNNELVRVIRTEMCIFSFFKYFIFFLILKAGRLY